jgi:hypothetical protein
LSARGPARSGLCRGGSAPCQGAASGAAARLLEDKLLCYVLQFAFFNKHVLAGLPEFLDRLDPFLAEWPADVPVAVEIRNKHWFEPAFTDCLRRHNAVWCLSDQVWMPSPLHIAQRMDPVTGGFTALVAVVLFLGVASAADPKSGPQVGDRVVPFHPLNCTGDHAGEKYCLICKNGPSPVAVIFARQVTPELIKLIKRIDEATDKNKERSMGSFVVLLSDSDNLEKELKELARKEKIQHCILTIDDPEGPKDYNIAPEAEVTVLLTVKANHGFEKGDLNDKGIEAIVADLRKILPE